jgi:formate-dependent phosphoribosylglycinamide formyltransferase (GAR transformylase)
VQTVRLAPVAREKELLTVFAERLALQTGESVRVDTLRWSFVNGRKNPAVVIQKRGKDRRVLATISKQGEFASLYESWQPVVEAWKAERLQTHRTDHSKLPKGKIPL